MNELKIHHYCRAIKDAADPVLKGLSPAGENEQWGLATASIMDSMGDIVRCEGIDYAQYHNPPSAHLAMFGGHCYALENGDPAVVGRVEEFAKVMVPDPAEAATAQGLAFRMSWAVNKEGAPTDLAAKYKELYASGYMSGFSVGLLVNGWGYTEVGLDIQKSTLFEISCTAIPALASAQVMRAIKDKLGDRFDPASAKSHVRPSVGLTLKAMGLSLATMGLAIEKVQKAAEAWSARPDLTSALNERLDAIESLLVVRQNGNAPPSTAQQQAGSTDSEALEKLGRAIGELKTFITR